MLSGFNEYYESVNIEILYFIYFLNFYVFRTVLLVTCIDSAPCFFANQLIRLRCILNPQNGMSTALVLLLPTMFH